MRAEIFVFTLFLLCGQSMSDHCSKLLHSLGTMQEEFVSCATTHAVPVEICMGCKKNYDNMLEAYTNFTKIENCTKTYIDNDRLNIISTVQSILIGLWVKAYCDGNNVISVSSRVSRAIDAALEYVALETPDQGLNCFVNNSFYVFDNIYNSFDGCVNITSHRNVCKGCLPAYQDLNSFYINLDQHNNAKVCYDMQDKMNRTRILWSLTYNCCPPSFDITLFLIASIVCAVLPFLFYTGMFVYGKRRERNHGVLDADTEDNQPLVPEEIAPSQQDAIVLPTQTAAPIPAKSMNIESDSEDDSDYGVKNNKIL